MFSRLPRFAYPLVNVYIAMKNHHAINGENPLFLWPFSIAMLVHQRVIFVFFFGGRGLQHVQSLLGTIQAIQAAGDVVLYSSAINACGKAENWPGALALFPGKKCCYLQVLRMLDVRKVL